MPIEKTDVAVTEAEPVARYTDSSLRIQGGLFLLDGDPDPQGDTFLSPLRITFGGDPEDFCIAQEKGIGKGIGNGMWSLKNPIPLIAGNSTHFRSHTIGEVTHLVEGAGNENMAVAVIYDGYSRQAVESVLSLIPAVGFALEGVILSEGERDDGGTAVTHLNLRAVRFGLNIDRRLSCATEVTPREPAESADTCKATPE